MRAVVLNDGRPTVVKRDRPEPQANEALLRVTLAGICATDLELVRGYHAHDGILGHEFVAVVEQCDSDTNWVGRRVVASINVSTCDSQCGLRCPEHCPRRSACGIRGRDGAFAEYIAIPISNLYMVPHNVPDETAVFTEPLAAALRIGEQIDIRDKRALVLGAGRLALLIAQALKSGGALVQVAARSTLSLQLPRAIGLSAAVLDDIISHDFDLVVDATGSPEGIRLAVGFVKPGGTMVIKSTYADTNFEGFGALMADIVVNEITVIGSRCGPFVPALRLLADGSVVTRPLVDGTYPLVEAVQALEHAARKGVRKILLKP